MGHAPLNWPQPDGYPDVAQVVAVGERHPRPLVDAHEPRRRLVAERQRQGLHLAQEPRSTRRQYPNHDSVARYLLPATLPKTWGAYVDALAARLLGQSLRPEHKTAVLTFMGKSVDRRDQPRPQRVQRRLVLLAAAQSRSSLLLDSPYHEMR